MDIKNPGLIDVHLIHPDSLKISLLVQSFYYRYPNFECFIMDRDWCTGSKNFELIEQLSEDLSEPLSDKLLDDAEELFHRQDCEIEYLEERRAYYYAFEEFPFEWIRDSKLEDLFYDFFIALEDEAERRKNNG